MLLVPGLIAVAAGPLLYQLARGGRSLLAALDGFAVVAVAGLALLHIIPDSISLAGWTAAGAALAGLAAPSLIALFARGGGQPRPGGAGTSVSQGGSDCCSGGNRAPAEPRKPAPVRD